MMLHWFHIVDTAPFPRHPELHCWSFAIGRTHDFELRIECTYDARRKRREKRKSTCELQWSKSVAFHFSALIMIWYSCQVSQIPSTSTHKDWWNTTTPLVSRRSWKTSYTSESRPHQSIQYTQNPILTTTHPPIAYPPVSLLSRGIVYPSHISSLCAPTIRPLVPGISPYPFKIQN